MVQHEVTAVTVSYGARGEFLAKVMARCRELGVGRMVVVENGCADAVKISLRDLESKSDGWLKVVWLGRNTGSAVGFSRGISAAMEMEGTRYLWLLDDDNVPELSSLEKLFQRVPALENDGTENWMLSCFRSARLDHCCLSQNRRYVYPPSSAFLGFDLWWKLKRRCFFWRKRKEQALPYAVYGGLFFPRAVVEKIGLPREEMVLYGDDWEWTRRWVDGGGKILFTPECRVEDLELSWHAEEERIPALARLLKLGSDFRAFYSVRNEVFFEIYGLKAMSFRYGLNRFLYLLLLNMASIFLNRRARFRLIYAAVMDGARGKLGVHPAYPLDKTG